MAIFIILAIFWPEQYPLGLSTFFYPLTFFILGFLFFTLDIMGGGDSKFLASFFLLIPVDLQEPFFEVLLWVALTISGTFLFYRSVRNLGKLKEIFYSRSWRRLSEIYGKKVPLAPIILFAWPIFGHIMNVWKLLAVKGNQLLNTYC